MRIAAHPQMDENRTCGADDEHSRESDKRRTVRRLERLGYQVTSTPVLDMTM